LFSVVFVACCFLVVLNSDSQAPYGEAATHLMDML